MLKKFSARILLSFFILVLCLDACVLVPFIDSYKEMGVTEGDRQALLAKTLKNFQDYIYWGQYNNALSFADEERGLDIKKSLNRYKEVKIVTMKTDDVTFLNSSKEANVNVIVKYYKIPQYIVVDEVVNETWYFNIGNWKIKERFIVSE